MKHSKLLCLCQKEMELWIVPVYDLNARFETCELQYRCKDCDIFITKNDGDE